MEPRDHAVFNAIHPGLPEMSGLRSKLNASVKNIFGPSRETPPLTATLPPAAVAIPLYIYPLPGAWDPLHKAVEQYPSIRFFTIVNPGNGPGGPVPDANYIREVAKLRSRPNVTVVGYVNVRWAERDINEVLSDVSTWSEWKNYAEADIGVDGIFVDEAPSDITMLQYMRSVRQHAKTRLTGNAVIWTNPGVIVDAAFYDEADMVNACENEHKTGLKAISALPPSLRSKTTVMLHGFCGDASQLRADTKNLRKAGYGTLLISTDSNYTSFGSMWEQYVAALAM